MRHLEIAVVIANLLAFVAVVVPRLRTFRGTPYVVFLAPWVAVVQGVVEGTRWAMISAYLLSGILLGVWVVQHLAPRTGFLPQPIARRSLAWIAVTAAILDLGLSIMLPTLLPVFQIPLPDGPYQIGTTTYHWVDANRHEIFSTDPLADRELMAQIWYPVKGDTSSLRAAYAQDANALTGALGHDFHVPGFLLDALNHVTTDAIPGAPVAKEAPSYPILIFSSGLMGYRQSNTFQVEDLVSHGFIVVTLDQPYAAATTVFPDGHQILGWTRDHMQPLIQQSLNPMTPPPTLNGHVLPQGIIPYFAQDIRFALDQLTALNGNDPHGLFTGRLEMQHVGVFGISLGAMVASEACHEESRIKACLMMDAAMPADVVQAGLPQPSIWLTRPASDMEREGWAAADIVQTLTTMHSVFIREPAGNGYYVAIAGMFHINFTDGAAFTPLGALWTPPLTGPIAAQRGFAIVNAYSLAFFEQTLTGRSPALLSGPSHQFPEVDFTTSSAGHETSAPHINKMSCDF